MDVDSLERRVKNLDRRVGRVEQILPTLATKADVEAAIEPLATRAELHAAIAAAIEPLATRAELHAAIAESEERVRTHFDVVAESLRDDIRLMAEGLSALSQRIG